jgi:hypothetical protein
MRKLLILSAFLATALLLLACSDSGACERGRRCRIPCWVTCVDIGTGADAKAQTYYYWCCNKDGNWQTPDAQCQHLDAITTTPALPSPHCGGGKVCDRETDNDCCASTRFYAMVCGKCTHQLRFALPWESHRVLYPIPWQAVLSHVSLLRVVQHRPGCSVRTPPAGSFRRRPQSRRSTAN